MAYNELLQQKEWWQKCNEILSRDRYRCRDCGCLGFHNGYNYMKVNRIEDIDALLKGWTFNDVAFSKFWANIPTRNPHQVKDIIFEKEYDDNDGIHVYDLNLLESKNNLFRDMFECPEKVIAVSKADIDCIDAIVYKYGSSIKKTDSSDASGWAYLFEFPYSISDAIYVNIEYYMPFVIEHVPYERTIINVTFGNRLISIRYTFYSFKLKGLNIHHTYYTRGCMPWEYDNDSLVTLCEDCHKKRHETSRIPLYDQSEF